MLWAFILFAGEKLKMKVKNVNKTVYLFKISRVYKIRAQLGASKALLIASKLTR